MNKGDNPFKDRIDEYRGKSDKEVLEYLYKLWQLDGIPGEDGSFYVVASYQYKGKDSNGFDCGYFVDIRGLNGDVLYYPFYLGKIQIYTTHKDFLTQKPLWKICVKLSDRAEYRWKNPFLLQLAKKSFEEPDNKLFDRVEKEKIIRELFDKRGKTEDDAQTIANALEILIRDVRTDSERFLFELLQNADDQPYNGEPVAVTFKALDNHLLVLHNGNPFSTDDIRVISNIGDKGSDKLRNKEKTGYKGIGFKSVFSDSDTVYIDSGGFSFAFDKHSPVYSKFNDINAIPWQIKPIWQEKYRLPREVAENISFFNSRVGIAIKAGHENVTRYNLIIPKLLDDPRFMLFMRNVESIRYESDSRNITASRKTRDGHVFINNDDACSEWIVQDYTINITENIRRVYLSGEGNKIPQKLKDAQNTTISFAINIENDIVHPIEKSLIFSYFPTKVAYFKFPFLVNADFSVNSSRESVHEDVRWNEFLFELIGKKIIEWIKSISNINGYLNALPDYQEELDSPLYKHFYQAYLSELNSESIVLTYKGELVKKGEVIIDETGLSSIIGADFFCKILNTTKYLPSDSIDKKSLNKKLFEDIERVRFDDVINLITDNTSFNNWFVNANDEKKSQLYRWINDHKTQSREEKIKSFVSSLPIFHFETENGYIDVSAREIKENNGFYEGLLLDYSQEVLQDLYENDHDNYIRLIENRDAKFRDAYWEGIIIRPVSYYVINTSNIYSVKDVIKKVHCHYLFSLEANCTKLPFNCSRGIFDESHPLFELVTPPDDEGLFFVLGESDFSLLDFDERRTLFFALKELRGIGPEKLKEVALFKNQKGEFKPLGEMSAYRENVPTWLSEYVLRKDEDDGSFGKYLIDDESFFEKIVWKHRNDIGVTITELYKNVPWTDEKYTKKLVDQYKQEERLQELLPIIEDDGTNNITKKYFLDKIDRVEFQSDQTYNKGSWEYKILKIAMDVYEDPSTFSNKIFFDGQCINSFSVSDDVKCSYGPKEDGRSVKFSLAKLLPQYQNKSDIITQFKHVFEEKKNMDVFFVTKPMPLSSIVRSLESKDYLGLTYGEWKYDKGGNAYQYLFYVYYYRGVKGWTSNYAIHIKLENESDAFIQEMMDFLKGNNIDIKTSPFTFRIHQYFTGKYFDNDFIFDTEQLLPAIEKWCGDDKSKREYLYANGVRRNTDYTIKFRQLFQRNEAIDFVDKMLDADLATSVRFIAQTDGYERPFVGDNQRAVLLLLKEKKLGNITSIRNLEKIIQESKEWDSKKYAQWIKNHHPKIYLYPGVLPNRLYYNTPNDNLLLDYEEDIPPYCYDRNSSRLFISEEKSVNEQLIKIVQDGNIPFTLESFQFLCLEGNDIISREEIEENKRINEEKDKKITELQEELKLYKSKFGEITSINEGRESVIQETNTSENDKVKHVDGRQEGTERSYKEKEREQYEQAIRSFLGGSFNLDQYNTKSEHIISCYRILKYLEGQGLQFAPEFDQKQFVNSDDYQQIKLQDGICVNPSSAKWGVWYIHPNVWRDIVINGNWACVCTGNGENDFILIKSEEDLEHIANTGESIIMKMSTSDNQKVFEVTNTVFPGVGNESMDIHLMIKLHDTPNELVNSLFDKAFASAQNDFTI